MSTSKGPADKLVTADPLQTLRKPDGPGRTGGVYIPPFKLARLAQQLSDKSSTEFQRMTWEALKKSINGLVNKVNVGNIQNLIPELFYENLIRGRGLLCRSIMKAQQSSTGFTNVYAATVAVLNTKLPELGELLLKRLVLQFRKSYARNNKQICLPTVIFIAHLVNQQIIDVVLPLQICTILLEKLSPDSVEVACTFLTECGQILSELAPQGFNRIFERFRAILHEGEIDKRVQYTIEALFAVRKTAFKEHQPVRKELDLVDLDDQITHEISLDDPLDPEDNLNFFRKDDDYIENEQRYEKIREEILGEELIAQIEGRNDHRRGNADGEEIPSLEGEEEGEGGEGINGATVVDAADAQMNAEGGGGSTGGSNNMVIQDLTETEVDNLRRVIYLTIMSSLDFSECAHKLMKMKMPPGAETHLCYMIIECCSQERTYMRFYGLLGHRFCMLDPIYQTCFGEQFKKQYSTIHRLETNKLRNVAKFFSHLLHTDAIPWAVLEVIHLNQDETTSSSRIFIKNVFLEIAEFMGLAKLRERISEPELQPYLGGLLPKDNPRDTRFSINFFTSIGLGAITDNLRQHLLSAPQRIMEQKVEVSSSESESDSDSSSSGSSSSSSSSESSSGSDSDEKEIRKRHTKKVDKKKKK